MNNSNESICIFDGNGECFAWVCYSGEECKSRDNDGNPMYASNEDTKNFKIKNTENRLRNHPV